MPTSITFHQLCRAGFESRMSRTGETEDDIAEAMTELYGSTVTGDDLRMMHLSGYSTHVLDMVAGTIGRSALEMVAAAMQMMTSGPHVSCPTCTCGLSLPERTSIAETFVTEGEEAARAAFQEVRAALGQVQASSCAGCGLLLASMQ